MARFLYTALDRSGKTINGELAAEEPEEVKRRLREMGYFPAEIHEAAQFTMQSGPGRMTRGRGVGGTDIVIFTRQLADMTAARLPLFRSLSCWSNRRSAIPFANWWRRSAPTSRRAIPSPRPWPSTPGTSPIST